MNVCLSNFVIRKRERKEEGKKEGEKHEENREAPCDCYTRDICGNMQERNGQTETIKHLGLTAANVVCVCTAAFM